jgi:hypothetical protein
MILPSRTEFETLILPKAEEYTLEYLSNPDKWGNTYTMNGKTMFYDDESSQYMENRRSDHLIDSWEVSLRLVGTKLKVKITAAKVVDGWNLEELLFEGTDDYEHPKAMSFWYRYMDEFFTVKKRKGIRPEIVKAFKMLQKRAVGEGGRRAIREWRKMKGYR